MKQSKVFLVFVLLITFLMMVLPSVVMAKMTENTTHWLGIVQQRGDATKTAYKIKKGDGSNEYLDIFKIVEYASQTDTTPNYSNDIYCIKGGKGFAGENDNPIGNRPYKISYDMKDYKNIPNNFKNGVLPTDTEITKTITIDEEEKEVTYTNYNAVLWILDNMYLPAHTNATEKKDMRDNLLKAAFKKELEKEYAGDPFTIEQINLTDSDIEVVQQLAIWHFTNPDDGDKYNMGTRLPEIQISENGGEYTAPSMDSYKSDDMRTLYTYLINNAMLNAGKYMHGDEETKGDDRHLEEPVQVLTINVSAKIVNEKMMVGPFKYLKKGEVSSLTPIVKDQKGKEIENYELYVGETADTATLANSDTKIENLADQSFYIAVPKNSDITKITLDLEVGYYESTPIFWTVEGGSNVDQPVVVVDKTYKTKTLSAELDYNFDLALRKFITGVNQTNDTDNVTTRIPKVIVDNEGKITYDHTKEPVPVESGDIVIYTIRVYNEGTVDGYVQEIKDNIPKNANGQYELEFLDPKNKKTGTLTQEEQYGYGINEKYGWDILADKNTIKTSYTSRDKNQEKNLLKGFKFEEYKNAGTAEAKKEAEPKYIDVKVAFRVLMPNSYKNTIENIAEITEDADKKGNPIEDIDSTPGNNENGEDDIDKEYIKLKEFDLALRKFITKVISPDGTEKTYNREPQHEWSAEKNRIIYKHPKDDAIVPVQNGDIVIYTIRVYNEGPTDGYADIIIDDIPDGLDYSELVTYQININNKWKFLDESNLTQIATSALSKKSEVTAGENLIKALDEEAYKKAPTKEAREELLHYKDVQIAFKVVEPNTSDRVLINTAEIYNHTDKNGIGFKPTGNEEIQNPTIDRDSTPGNKNEEGKDTNHNFKEDDIDKEYVKLEQPKKFDLALRKFITAVNDKEITNRVPEAKIGENGKVTYIHTKEPVLVANTNIVTYTIRVYNEGQVDGYAQLIRDDVPEHLEFLPDHAINKQYGWKLDGNTVTTDYLSKAKSEDNLIKAVDNKKLYYKDVKIAFKVSNEKLEPGTILINTAEIADDADAEGKPVDDIDSTPDNKNEEGKDENHNFKEDDIDKEYVKLQYFDLSLLKWVNKVIVTVDGVTTERETGHTGLENPEPVVKQEINRKKIDKTTVKFEYTIKITNEGQIQGFATEISDYIPEGLEFIKEDNPNWTVADGKVTTRALENTLLKPGESAEVKIILTWIRNAENMGVKTNVAEISEDDNDFDAPDIDSTPNNKVPGEDDIDDAPVALSISTGSESVVYFGLIGATLTIVIGGVTLIKKYVI